MATVDALKYAVVEGWEQLPEGYTHRDVPGVSVDSQDRVYIITRLQPRVIVYDRDGAFVASWGEPGTGPGQFHLPHGIWVAPDGRVLVADRENDRIQVFNPEGAYLDQWTDVQRPTALFIDSEGLVYVSELAWKSGDRSFVHGAIATRQPGRVSVFDRDGTVLARWGGDDPCAAGNFAAPHDICADSQGTIYVGEVTHAFTGQFGEVPDDCHTLQAFARRS